MSQSGFGLFSYLHVAVELFQHCFGGGIDNVAARYYKQDSAWPTYWQGGIAGRLFICGIGAVIGLFVFNYPYNFLFAGWFILLMLGRIFYAYANTLLLSGWIISASTISAAVLIVSSIIGIKAAGVGGLLLAFVFERLTEVIILSAGVIKHERSILNLPEFAALWAAIKKIVWLSIPLWFTQGLYILYSRLDAVLVKQLLGLEDLAVYALTYRFAEAPLLIFAAIADSSLAFFFREPELMSLHYRQIKRRVILAGGLIVIVIHVLIKCGFLSLLGDKYQGIAPLLASYSWALFFMGLNFITSSYVLARGMERVYPRIGVIVLVTNLLGNLILIPRVGVIAPCLVTVASSGVNYILLRLAIEEYRCQDLWLVGGVLSCAGLSAVLYS